MSRLLYDYEAAAIKACEITDVVLIGLEIRDERDLVLTWQDNGKQYTFIWELMGIEDPDSITDWICDEINDYR